jgi:plasmid stabilization system protein ParE
MSRQLRYADAFLVDLERYYGNLALADPHAAERAFDAVAKALELLADFPFVGRKVNTGDDSMIARELLIPFGTWGYVILYEIEDAETITVLAIRHQRKDDYH